MQRVFIAIPVSQELAENISEFRNTHNYLPVRWTKAENLHITLIPPINVTAMELQELSEKLSSIQTPPPFPLQFNEAKYGPTAKSPRMIWASGNAPAELSELQVSIASAMRYQIDRQLKLHITLARFKPSDLTMNLSKNLHKIVKWKMLVNEFVIMESKLLPDGAEYTIIEKFSLN